MTIGQWRTFYSNYLQKKKDWTDNEQWVISHITLLPVLKLQYPIEEQLLKNILRYLFSELSSIPPINRWVINRTQIFLPLSNILTALQIQTYITQHLIHKNLFPPHLPSALPTFLALMPCTSILKRKITNWEDLLNLINEAFFFAYNKKHSVLHLGKLQSL